MSDQLPETPDSTAEPTAERHGNLLTVAKGGGFLAAGDVFDYLSRTVSALVLARVLGASDYGLYNLAVSAAFVFSGLADFGLDAAMERFIPVFQKRKDYAGVRGSIQLGVAATVVGSGGLGLALLFFAPSIADGIFHEPALTLLLRVFAFIVPLLALSNLLAAVARGYKRMDYSAFAYDFVQPMVRVVLVLVFVLVGLDALTASIIFGISYLAAVLVLIYLVRKEGTIRTKRAKARRDVKDLAVFSFPFWFVTLMTKIRTNLQSLLLGAFNSATSVGIFSLAGSANLIGRIANLSISTSMRPVLAELFEAGDSEEMGRLYKTTTRWTLTLNLPIFIVLVAFPGPILGIFGQSFVAGAAAMSVLALSELANAITGTCGSIVDMSGKGLLKMINKVTLVGWIIGGNLLLIPPFGIMGAAWAVLIGTVLINLMRIIEVRSFAGIQPWDLRLLKPLAAGAVAFGAGKVVDAWLPADQGLAILLFDALIVGAVFLTVLAVLRIPEEERIVIRKLYDRGRSALSRLRS